MNDLFKETEDKFGVTKTQLLCQLRNHKFVRARKFFARKAHRDGHSYADIGRCLNRSWTTIRYHVKRVK